MAIKGLQNEQNTGDPVTFDDLSTTIGAVYENEGIIDGVVFTTTTPNTSVAYSAGHIAIDLGNGNIANYYTDGGTLDLSGNTAGVYYLAVLKIDTSAATETIEILTGTAATDPNLTETATTKYVVLARITGTGGAITASNILQLGSNLTNNSTPEIIAKQAKIKANLQESSWNIDLSHLTFTFGTDSDPIFTMTTPGDITDIVDIGMKVKLTQTTDKFFIVDRKAFSSNITTLTLFSNDYNLTASAITDVYLSTVENPYGFSTSALTDGWRRSRDTWVFGNATTFTITGVDRTSLYTKGTKLKWVDSGGVKFGYVSSSSFVSNTNVTLVENSDYSLASGIVSNYYSYESNPQGFPTSFSINSTLGGNVGWSSYTTFHYRFAMDGKKVTLEFHISGTSNSTSTSIFYPNGLGALQTSSVLGNALSITTNNGTVSTSGGRVTLTGGAIAFYTDMSTGAWTASGTKTVAGSVTYFTT
jgi:hypothetical protein